MLRRFCTRVAVIFPGRGVFCQENGPAGAEEGKSADADKSTDSGGGGSSSRSKSTTHFTPDELQAILQVD